MTVIIIVSVWKYMGYYMVVYLAALQGISQDLYEAAGIDGATGFKKFRYITIPMLKPTTFFVIIMMTIQCFKVFDLIYVMTGGGPGRSTNVLVKPYLQRGLCGLQVRICQRQPPGAFCHCAGGDPGPVPG